MKYLFQKLIAILVIAAFAGSASAETVLWKGWSNFGSCNRIKYYTDDFGIRWPTNQSVGQTISTEVYLTKDIAEIAANRLKTCALVAVGAAGATAVATAASGAWAAFVASFNSCVVNTGITEAAGSSIGMRHATRCNW